MVRIDNDILSEIVDELSYEIENQKLLKKIELKLRKNFGGTFCYISKRGLIKDRNEQIINDYSNSKDINKICHKYGLSYYWVLKILKEKGVDYAKKSGNQDEFQQQFLFA